MRAKVMTIEQLTDEERKALERGDVLDGPKALRIIDANAADRASLVAQLEAATAETEQVAVRYREERDAHDRLLEEAEDYSGKCEALRAQVAELTRKRDEARGRKPFSFQIRFDGPTGPESGRFVECETLDGKGVNVGRWEQDGEYWLLMVEGHDAPVRLESEVQRLKVALSAIADEKVASEARVRELEARPDPDGQRWLAAEADIAALRAECNRQVELSVGARNEAEALRVEVSDKAETIRAQNIAYDRLESRLAAANALLEWHRDLLDELRQLCFDTDAEPKPQWSAARDMNRLLTIGQKIDAARKGAVIDHGDSRPEDVGYRGESVRTGESCDVCNRRADVRYVCRAHLAAQPATAPARTEGEQAVLDIVCQYAVTSPVWMQQMCPTLYEAELARRGLSNKKDKNDV